MGVSFEIYEDTFVKNALSSYNLSALVGADRFSFLGYDLDQQKVHFLKSYQYLQSSSEEIIPHLHEIYNQEHLLKTRYHRILIGISTPYSTLIPARLFKEEFKHIYLEKLCPSSTDDETMVDDIPELDVKQVFKMHKGMKHVLNGYFPNAKLVHASTLFIKGVHRLSQHRTGHQLYLNVDGNHFQLVLFEDQDLLFSNVYSFKNVKDFIYFTMLAFDQFKLKTETVPLYLCGQIEEESEIYKLLYRYIRHIHFIHLPDFLNFGPLMKSKTSHHYFTLYCSKLCV